MLTDVKAYRATATGTLFNQRARIKGVVLTGTAGVGSAVFRDGGAGGTVVLELDLLANAEKDITIPGEGILCQTDVHVTISGLASVVAFCG
jgi:hypothetical protein